MRYVNHDLISSVSVKAFMGYVNCQTNNMMNFKILKTVEKI